MALGADPVDQVTSAKAKLSDAELDWLRYLAGSIKASPVRDREATKRCSFFGIKNTVPSNVTRQFAGKRHSTSPTGVGVQERSSAIGGVH